MPRYYFHVRDGVDRPDARGVELPDIQAARSEAIKACGEILRDIDGKLEHNAVWEMEVADVKGRTLLRYSFIATEDIA